MANLRMEFKLHQELVRSSAEASKSFTLIGSLTLGLRETREKKGKTEGRNVKEREKIF